LWHTTRWVEGLGFVGGVIPDKLVSVQGGDLL
jgi:hypothetical protein